jgi:hypothetical protein
VLRGLTGAIGEVRVGKVHAVRIEYAHSSSQGIVHPSRIDWRTRFGAFGQARELERIPMRLRAGGDKTQFHTTSHSRVRWCRGFAVFEFAPRSDIEE